jgi:hypothetical protein
MAETNGNPTPDRLAELELENAQLRAELNSVRTWYELEHRMLDAFSLREIPLTDEEIKRVMDGGKSISDILAEFESENGAGGAA